MDLRTFAAFLIMAVCFIKQSDGQITAWAETGGNSATITGASGTMTVAALSESVAANGALFTVTATPTGTDTIASYAFTTGGNPGTAGTIATATSGAVTATNAISDSIATSYVFEIIATDSAGNMGTATVTLSVADLPGLSDYEIPVCLADGAAIGTAVTTLSATNTVTSWVVSDTTNFAVSNAGAVTTAVATSASTKAGYAITVTATDANSKTSVANIWIVVGICSGAMKMTVTAALVMMSFVSAYLI
ncbi:endoglucanase D-like [Mya arenaria]|uniref:endoglucanase D-like n=1 Tax=Mya arenaria TaxID=6604 RepID=UPI0022E5FE11|nr:endoglucanase D-like [Mya arenaria]